tara:strand:- start:1083 stop:2291 length:1209 start_codon:yes stop_codon:yes gene_type:complete
MSIGKSEISNLLEADDIKSTIQILKLLGIKIHKRSGKWIVYGNGTNGFLQPKKVLNAQNSGTTARTMIGAVSSNPINCKFIGDKSLSKRSMSRVTKYLEKLGARFRLTKNDYLPLETLGTDKLTPEEIMIKKPSAQIKTALIFAGLNLSGKISIREKVLTRDHTEKLLKYLDIKHKRIEGKDGSNLIELNGPYEIYSKNIKVAGDPSSAAFFIVGALITPGSKITLKNVMLNPTRVEYLKVLKKMGGKISIKKTDNVSGEQCGNITASYSNLKGININKSLSPFLIDEYPIISIAASCATGVTKMNGVGELRHKESDRIKSIVLNLKKIGVKAQSIGDNIHITGSSNLNKKICKIKTFGDHRIACSFMTLALLNKNIEIDNEKCVSISYPNFKRDLKSLLKK